MNFAFFFVKLRRDTVTSGKVGARLVHVDSSKLALHGLSLTFRSSLSR